MATIGGPNTEKDNLVFGYDTGYGVADNNTTTRFYPGEPTTNEFYSSGSDGNILDYSSGYGGYGTAQTGALDAFGTTENTVYRNTGKIRLGPTGGQDIGTLTNGNTYTFSVYLRHVPGENNIPGSNGFEFDIVDKADSRNYSGTLNSNMTYDWKRFSVTALHNNNSNYHFIDVGTYLGTNVWEWCMPQIDVGSHATPYTRTSRSSTASLIDLKRTTNIDLLNASFDSTGQPDLDGTSDYFQTTTSCGITGNITLEAVFNEESATSPHTTVICTDTDHQKGVKLMSYKNSNRYGLWLGFGTSDYVAMVSGTLNNDTVYHLVGTWERVSGTVKIYLNGELTGTINTGQTSAVVLNTGKITVGVDYHGLGNSYGLNGQVYVGKVYNRVITSEEIQQNFNAYKNRFNI